jgi:hypothetical protein
MVLLFLAGEPCYGLSVRVDKKYITNGTERNEDFSIPIRKTLPDEVEKIAQVHLQEHESMLTSPRYSQRKRAMDILTAEGFMDDDMLLFYLENNLDKRFHEGEYALIRSALAVLHKRSVDHEQETAAFLEKAIKTSDDRVITIHSAILLLSMGYVAIDDFLSSLRTELQKPLKPFGATPASMKYLVEIERYGELQFVFDLLFSRAYTGGETCRKIVDFLIELSLDPRYYERTHDYAQEKLIQLRLLGTELVRINNAFNVSNIMDDIAEGEYEEQAFEKSVASRTKAQTMIDQVLTTTEQRELFLKTADAYLVLGNKHYFNFMLQIGQLTKERKAAYYSYLLRVPEECDLAGTMLKNLGVQLSDEQLLIWAYSAVIKFATFNGGFIDYDEKTIKYLFNEIADIDDPRVDTIFKTMLPHDNHVLRTLAFQSLLKRRQPAIDEIQRYYSVTFKDMIERHERALLVREYIDHIKIGFDDAALKKYLQRQLTSEDRTEADIAAAALKKMNAFDTVSVAMKLLYDIPYLEGLQERHTAVQQYYDLLHDDFRYHDKTLFTELKKLKESGMIKRHLYLTNEDIARELAENDPRFDDEGYKRTKGVQEEGALAFDTIALQSQIFDLWSKMKDDFDPVRNEARMLLAA